MGYGADDMLARRFAPVIALTDRQREVLTHAARGLTAGMSGAESFHEAPTVRRRRAFAAKRLGASNTTHAVAIALRSGLIDYPPREHAWREAA